MWSILQDYHKQVKYLSFFLCRGWWPLRVHCWLEDSLASPPADNKLPFSQPESAKGNAAVDFHVLRKCPRTHAASVVPGAAMGLAGRTESRPCLCRLRRCCCCTWRSCCWMAICWAVNCEPEITMWAKSHRLGLVHTARALYVLISQGYQL